MDFSTVKSLTIPEGDVTQIASGSTILWKKEEQGLPSGFQRVSYIKSDGTPYIDTGVHYSGGKIVCVFDADNLEAVNRVFGVTLVSDAQAICVLSVSDQYMVFEYGSSTQNASSFGTFISPITLTVDGNYLYIQSELDAADVTAESNVFNGTVNMHIFGANSKLDIHYQGGINMMLKQFTYTVSDNIVLDFIPCYRISDGTIGLYKMENNVPKAFLTNANTSGAFTKGADVN